MQSENRRYEVQCDICHQKAEGNRKDLGEKGWKMTRIVENLPRRKKYLITYCKDHNQNYGIEIGLHMRAGHGIKTIIGGLTIGGPEANRAWQEAEAKKDILKAKDDKYHHSSLGARA